MKALLLTLLLALLPLVFGYYLNATSPAPVKTYSPARCTRYCAAHGCHHATQANSPVYFRLRPLYALTIRGLSLGGPALYGLVNIAFYLVFMPLLLVWLTYGALRDAGRIRHLRNQL